MQKPKILVFASGTSEGGGSGFRNLIEASRDDRLMADIVGVVSNHRDGGVSRHAKDLGITFFHFPSPYTAERYKEIAKVSRADFFALSGWLKLVTGLDPRFTFNIHPGPLPKFGGKGMYGHFVHEAVMEAYNRGKLVETEVCMHFVTEAFDEGPVFWRHKIPIKPGDTPETLAKRVNETEHAWQPLLTNLVVHRAISWNGWDPRSLQLP